MAELYIATGDGLARLSRNRDCRRSDLLLRGSHVQCLALDPHHAGHIYAGSFGEGIWKSCDGGENWSSLALAPDQSHVLSLAVSPADGSVYAGCEPSMVLRSTDGGAHWTELESLRSIPSAPQWSFPPRPWTSHVRWIAPSPDDAELLLVGIELGGLMTTRDGGATWQDHAPGAQKDVHALAWHPTIHGRAYQAGGGGAAWTTDNGHTWQPADAGRDRHYTWALAVNPADPDCWFVSASPGPGQAHSGQDAEALIYRWRGHGPWEPIMKGLPQPLRSMPYALTFSEAGLFAGMSDGSVFVSDDCGDSWQQLQISGDGLTCVRAVTTAEA